MKFESPLVQEIIAGLKASPDQQRAFGILLNGAGAAAVAEGIARTAGTELHRIDLRQVVSKYIGETEKNLTRVFNEAATEHAVLFFDEADTLFGKRTEVKDAHDRFANIEINYLLQRIEEYEGITILATKQRHHIDEAFVRRLRYVIDLDK